MTARGGGSATWLGEGARVEKHKTEEPFYKKDTGADYGSGGPRVEAKIKKGGLFANYHRPWYCFSSLHLTDKQRTARRIGTRTRDQGALARTRSHCGG